MRAAREGDVLIEVACCDAGPVLVLDSLRPRWRCGACRSAGVEARRFTVARTFPTDDWWDKGVLSIVEAVA